MISLHILQKRLDFIVRMGSIQKTNQRFQKYAIIVRLIKQLYINTPGKRAISIPTRKIKIVTAIQ